MDRILEIYYEQILKGHISLKIKKNLAYIEFFLFCLVLRIRGTIVPPSINGPIQIFLFYKILIFKHN